MAQKLSLTILFVLTFFKHNVYAQAPVIFDITKYGAKPGQDISKELENAWKAACASPKASKVVIPRGKWVLSQAKLHGPNKARLKLQVQGTVQAYSDVAKLPNRKGEWISIAFLNYFTLSGGGIFDGNGRDAWKLNDCHKNKNCPSLPINLSFNFINNSVIHDVTTKDSKNFHVNCLACNNMVFVRFTVSAPDESPNTDGIHLAHSTSINVTDSIIMTGDDCISMGDRMKQVYIENVTCGPGHGISVGSLGNGVDEQDVSGIHVKNCTFINTLNGVRVKTWPSAPATLKISDLNYENLVMVNVSNPIIIDQQYCPHNLCNPDKPSLIQVSDVKIKNIKGTTSSQEAMAFWCSSRKPCKNVEIYDVDLKYTGNEGLITTKCANILPILGGKKNPPACRYFSSLCLQV